MCVFVYVEYPGVLSFLNLSGSFLSTPDNSRFIVPGASHGNDNSRLDVYVGLAYEARGVGRVVFSFCFPLFLVGEIDSVWFFLHVRSINSKIQSDDLSPIEDCLRLSFPRFQSVVLFRFFLTFLYHLLPWTRTCEQGVEEMWLTITPDTSRPRFAFPGFFD